MKKKSLLDSFEEKVVFIAAAVAICTTIVAFFLTRFNAAEAAAFWTQLSYYAYGWGVCFGVACCVKTGSFMVIDVISSKYPEGVKKAISVISQIVMLLIWIFLFVFTIKLVSNSGGVMNAAAPSLPVIIAYLAPVFGYAFAIIRSIQKMFGKEFEA